MRISFRIFMALHVFFYRLSGGRIGGSMRGFNLLLLTTKGSKTGKLRTTPLGNFDHPDGFLIVASNAGSDSNPSWYYNLKKNPHVIVQVMDKVMNATAEELSGNARQAAWQIVISKAVSYADYEKHTDRIIPLILLHPSLSED